MKTFLVIFFFIGSIWTLQYPVEYRYQYEGRLASGIPSIRPQVAALGIKAHLVLQMKERSHGIAKLEHVQVGEYNDDLNCVELRDSTPFHYIPMPEPHKQNLEKPFAVYFQEESGEVMKVAESDVEFVTNIRKSVIEMLRLEPLIANLGGMKRDKLSKMIHDDKHSSAFSVEEESILGKCEGHYTITRLPPFAAQTEKERVKELLTKDDQSQDSPRYTKSNIPKLKEQYYRLIRSINFDNCQDKVIQQHSGGANTSHVEDSQFRSVQSRSSISTYLLKGEPGKFRVERAIVEGDVIANPFGFKTQRLHTIINQTLVLKSAQPIHTPLRLPSTRPVKTWRYEVASPFSQPQKHHKQWINYHDKGDKYYPVSVMSSLGLPPSHEEIQEYKKSILEMLNEAIKEIYSESVPPPLNPSKKDSKNSIAASLVHRMTKSFKSIPLKTVQEIFSIVFKDHDIHSQRKQSILVDVAAASGASAPIKVLLDLMKRKEISHARIASILMTLPNNLFAPSVIPDLLDYVKTMDLEKEPIAASSALNNFASLAEKACINKKRFMSSLPHAIFGKEDCDPSLIIKEFLPHLTQKAESAKSSWERAVYLQAMSNLGTPLSLPTLTYFIEGRFDSNINVRLVSIYGLLKRHLPDSAREKVFDALMTLVEDVEERTELREAAFLTLSTWHPDAAWWQRMARLTWREPSQSFAAYISLTIESLAKSTQPILQKQARIAAFAVPLLKPISPSQKNSYKTFYSRYDPHSKIGVNADFSVLRDSQHGDGISKDVYNSLRENFGDLYFDLYEISVTSVDHLVNSLRMERGDRRALPLIAKSRLSRQFERTRSHLEEFNKESVDKRTPSVYLQMFESLVQYVPLDQQVITRVFGEGGKDFLKKLIHGQKIDFTKYVNPIDIEYFIPTEIGLPLVGSVMLPIINMDNAHAKLSSPDNQDPTFADLLKEKHLSLHFKSNYKYMSNLIVKQSTIAPWSNKIIEVGVENFEEFNLPVDGSLQVLHTHEVLNATLSLTPNTQKKLPLLHSHNIPFTQIRKILPSQDKKNDYKIIAVKKTRDPAHKSQKHFDEAYTGFAAELNYSGDSPYPFTTAFLADYLRKPVLFGKLFTSPVAEQWQYALNLDPSSSKSKTVSFTLASFNEEGSSSRRGSSSSCSKNENILDLSLEDDDEQLFHKLRSYSEGSKIHGVLAQLSFYGSDVRKYKSLFAVTQLPKQSNNNKHYKTAAIALATRVPGHTDGPKALCSFSNFETVDIKSYNDLKEVLSSNPREEISSNLYYGSSCCHASKIAAFKGSLSLSKERQNLIEEEITQTCKCKVDPRNPTLSLQTAAVYDKGHFEVDFVKENIPRALLNVTYSLRDNFDGYVFPHGYFNNMHNGVPNKIVLDANMPLSSNRYTISVDMPTRRAVYSEIRVPYALSKIVPREGLNLVSDMSSDFTIAPTTSTTSEKCTLRNGSIETFDVAIYNYTAMHCWQKIAIDVKRKSEFMVRFRQNVQDRVFQAQISVHNLHAAADAKFTWEDARINGDKMDPSEKKSVINDNYGRPIIEVNKYDDYFEGILIGNLTVKVTKDKVEVTPQSSLRNVLRGLCGDYDGTPKYDKTGPRNCLYTNDELFAWSWTDYGAQGCQRGEFDHFQDIVHTYQQACPHRPNGTVNYNLNSTYETKNKNCYEKVYPVQMFKAQWCVSIKPVQICKKTGCAPQETKLVHLTAGCWPENAVPSDVEKGEGIGYLTQPPKEKAPSVGRIAFKAESGCTAT